MKCIIDLACEPTQEMCGELLDELRRQVDGLDEENVQVGIIQPDKLIVTVPEDIFEDDLDLCSEVEWCLVELGIPYHDILPEEEATDDL